MLRESLACIMSMNLTDRYSCDYGGEENVLLSQIKAQYGRRDTTDSMLSNVPSNLCVLVLNLTRLDAT